MRHGLIRRKGKERKGYEGGGNDKSEIKLDFFCDSIRTNRRINRVFFSFFVLSSQQLVVNLKPNHIVCRLGEQAVDFLIDSGSPVTTIPAAVWTKVRKDWELGAVKLFDWTKNGSRELRGYAANGPLKVRCSFKAELKVSGHNKPTRLEEIFVVEEAAQALLGEAAAKAMKLLKVGVEVNHLRTREMEARRVSEEPKLEEENDERFPSIPNLQLSFDIDESIPPRKDFRYDIPQSLEASLNDNLRKLERQGIIEPAATTPEWVSRLKAVTKANGDVRWVVTMLGPNKAIRRVFYPMPTMDKLAVNMQGAKYFSKLDIKNAFFHVELDERARQMTTFMTSKGPMRFTRLAFGVNCAPEAFQKIMEDCLRGCAGVAIFIDDILIYAKSLEELRARTNAVKERLRENNLTLNNEKCAYEREETEFLGHTVNSEGIRPTEDKIRDIQACKKPTSATAVRSFLGMVNFMASFIPNLSAISEPLRRLTGKTKEFAWGAEQDEAFKLIKATVAQNVFTRGFFNEKEETWLYTDASPTGLGAVLVQENAHTKVKRVIAFASKALTPTEAKYPQTQREALAVVWGVEKFHFYLIGRQFHLVVDHAPLKYIFSGEGHINKRATTRAEGWAVRLSTYRFDIQVVRSEMNIADYLSRESNTDSSPFNDYAGKHELGALTVTITPAYRNGLQAVTMQDIKRAAGKDEVFAAIRTAIETTVWPKELQKYAAFQDELTFPNEILLRASDSWHQPASGADF